MILATGSQKAKSSEVGHSLWSHFSFHSEQVLPCELNFAWRLFLFVILTNKGIQSGKTSFCLMKGSCNASNLEYYFNLRKYY